MPGICRDLRLFSNAGTQETHMSFEPKNKAFSKARARSVYLAKIKKLRPDVLESLRDDLLPVFDSLMQSAYRYNPALRFEDVSRAEVLRMSRDNASLEDVVREVDSWCDRWNIKPEWFVDVIFQTLERWRTFEPARDVLEWSPASFGYFEPASYRQPIEFKFRTWNPISGEGRNSYATEARKAFTEYLNSYLDARAESLQESGWIKRGGVPKREYLRWLVMNQIERKSAFTIAKCEFPKQWERCSRRDDFILQIDRIKQGLRRAIAAMEPD